MNVDKISDAEGAELLAELEQVDDLDSLRPAARQTPAEALKLERTNLTHRRRVSGRIFHDRRDGTGNAKELLQKLPPTGTTLHAILPGNFTPCDLVPAIIELAGATFARQVHLSTLGFSVANVQTLCALLDSKTIRSLSLVCSKYFRAASREIYAVAERELPARGALLIATRSHCKVFLLCLSNGDKWVIEGSGNLRSCTCLEQIAVCQDAKLFAFHRAWLTHLFKNREDAE